MPEKDDSCRGKGFSEMNTTDLVTKAGKGNGLIISNGFVAKTVYHLLFTFATVHAASQLFL